MKAVIGIKNGKVTSDTCADLLHPAFIQATVSKTYDVIQTWNGHPGTLKGLDLRIVGTGASVSYREVKGSDILLKRQLQSAVDLKVKN